MRDSTIATMSAACLTASTDASLCGPLVQRLRVVQGEAIGHAGHERNDRIRLVAACDEVLEDAADRAVRARVLAARVLTEVDPLEHERAEREQRVADLVALTDVAGRLRRVDDVAHQRVDTRGARRAEQL